jgi:hypothetical protein
MAIQHRKNKAANRLSLDDIFNSPDKFGLLDVSSKAVSKSTPRDVSSFEEINAFTDEYGRPPSPEGDLKEKLLARRLASYQNNFELNSALITYDRHGLLTSDDLQQQEGKVEAPSIPEEGPNFKEPSIKAEDVTSLDDIFASAEFDVLDLGDTSIFEMTHVPSISESDREQPDEVAQRRVCHDFDKFEHVFHRLHEELKTGVVTTVRFQQESNVAEGDAFIVEGVLCLIDEIGEYREDGEGRYNPRLRVIFENGTESNHLLRSLAKRLYMDDTGRRIVRGAESVEDAFNNISVKDKRTGQIYFVKSLSDNPALKSIPHLIKIGYTESTVEGRTKNAINDIAFLEAPVKIVASFECYNLNPNKFETLIHGFLYAQRLNVTLVSQDGRIYKPQEWFTVSLDTAIEVVERIIDGTIVNYRMDNTTNRIVKKAK